MLIAGACVLPLIMIAALTENSGYAVHAMLGVLACVASIVLIANRCFDGTVPVEPREIDGKPN